MISMGHAICHRRRTMFCLTDQHGPQQLTPWNTNGKKSFGGQCQSSASVLLTNIRANIVVASLVHPTSNAAKSYAKSSMNISFKNSTNKSVNDSTMRHAKSSAKSSRTSQRKVPQLREELVPRTVMQSDPRTTTKTR